MIAPYTTAVEEFEQGLGDIPLGLMSMESSSEVVLWPDGLTGCLTRKVLIWDEAHVPDHDAPLNDPHLEELAQYLGSQILRPGQRLCVLSSGKDGQGKTASPVAQCFDPDSPWCRNLIRRHVSGRPARIEHRNVEGNPDGTKTTIRTADVLALGAYYGGWNDIGNNLCLSFALDCDESDEVRAALKGLKTKEEREKFKAALKADPSRLEHEKKLLLEMLALAKAAFPQGAFFVKPNGKWHGHINIVLPIDGNELKNWVRERLPERLQHIEVFPKSATSGPLPVYGVGNQIRLPFSSDSQY